MRRQNANIISPRLIHLVAWLILSTPVTYIILLGALYNLPLVKIGKIFFSFIYWAHSLIAIFSGWSLLKMKPYAWHSFFVLCILMLAEQIYIAYSLAENYFVPFPLVTAITVIMVLFYLVTSELRVPYFSPRIAWWESDPRYKISVPSQITTPDHLYDGEIMDISAGGCFVKTKASLYPDQIIHLRFSLFEKNLGYSGRIVWKTESTVTLPKGVGIKFLGMNRTEQSELRATVKKLRKLSDKFKRDRREERAISVQQKIENLLGPK